MQYMAVKQWDRSQSKFSLLLLLFSQLVCVEQKQREQVRPVRGAGSADNQRLRKGSWVRGRVKD